MKVKELIEQVQGLDPEIEIRLCLRKGWRPYGTKKLTPLEPVFDQDKNRLGFYSIDVDTEIEYPETKEKLIIPENESDVKYK